MHIFLITMPGPSPRRQSALQKLLTSNLSFEIVDGVQASKWRESELPLETATCLSVASASGPSTTSALVDMAVDMPTADMAAVDMAAVDMGVGTAGSVSAGEVGCYLAHLHALQRLVDYRLPWACVLEDDFCFEAEPEVGLAEIEQRLPHDFHYIHLQRDLNLNPHMRVISRHDIYERIVGTPLCTTGYIITRPLAEYILKHHSRCGRPIDHLYNQLSRSGNFYKPVKPLIGIQVGLAPVIQR